MACGGTCDGCPQQRSCHASGTDAVSAHDIEDLRRRAETAEALVRQLRSERTDGNVNGSNGNLNQHQSLRSQRWFDNPDDLGLTALYLERYLNFGITRQELQSGKPIIGIAQSGSDLSPCNRHHLTLAQRVRDGIIAAGGVPLEFPTHPIQETGKRPTASLDRNLAYLSLSEVLFGYPLDGVVLLTGCDKTTPACLMAAATVNIPAIVLNVGPMLNGYWKSKLTGSGTIVWESRAEHAAGRIDNDEYWSRVVSSATSVGHCNTM
jgi:dihydroxy-acid dehydratase